MKYCKKCGKEFDDSMNTCPNCDYVLEPSNSNINYYRRKKLYIITSTVLILLGLVCFAIFKINNHNKKIIEANKLLAFATYKGIGEFGGHNAEGLALVRKESKDEAGNIQSRYGFINTRFEECIPCIYQRIEPFERNYAIVELNDKYALMNKKGEIELALKYDKIMPFEDRDAFDTNHSFALAETNGSFTLINRRGKALCQEYDEIDYADWEDDCWGDSYKRLARIKKGDKWGYLDNNFYEDIHCIYNDAHKFYKSVEYDEPIAPVRLFAEWKWIDRNEDKKYIEDGTTIVELSDKYAVMDKKGEIKKELEYTHISKFYKNHEYHTPCSFAEAEKDGYETLINREGDVLCAKYDQIYFSEWHDDELWGTNGKRLAYVFNDCVGFKIGFMDNDFKEIVPCIYDDCCSFHRIDSIKNAICAVALNGKWGIIDSDGKKIIDCIYDEQFRFDEYELIDEENNKTIMVLAKVKKEGKEFYIDKNGKYFGSNDKHYEPQE